MTALLRSLSTASLAAILLGCGNSPTEGESWGSAQQALNACNETVATNRAVDGIPAYAQCDGIENGAIWSNNGVDTASSSQGDGWIRTQYSGGYQCTELARRYMIFRWDVDYQHGNAGEWCDGTLPSTLKIATAPSHGDLIVFAPGSCGADSTTGHVAIVDTVDMAGSKVTIVEQNQASRRSTQQSCAKCFLHAVANDGNSGGAGSGGAASGGAASGGAASGGAANGGAANGGSPAAGATSAGASSGGVATGGAGSSSGGSAAGGAPSAGAPSGASGQPTTGGAAAGSSPEPGAAGSNASPTTGDAEDASCNVGRAKTSGNGAVAGLLLAGIALVIRLVQRANRSARA